MITLDTLTLPSGLSWADEYNAQSVAQTVRRTLDGGQVITYAGLQAGRHITLTSGEDFGWVRKSVVDALATKAASPGAIYSLSIRGQTYPVLFLHHEPPALDATPLWPVANPQSDDYYRITLKLITV